MIKISLPRPRLHRYEGNLQAPKHSFITRCIVPSLPQGFLSPFFASQTVDRLLSNSLSKSSAKQSYNSLASIQSSSSSSQNIDIFLSNVWPASITQLSSAPLPDPQLSSIGVPPLDDVIAKIKPRYHFAAAGGRPPKFWEREPFVWDGEDARISRFISLGAFGNEPATGKKQRVGSLVKVRDTPLTFHSVVLCFQYSANNTYHGTGAQASQRYQESLYGWCHEERSEASFGRGGGKLHLGSHQTTNQAFESRSVV